MLILQSEQTPRKCLSGCIQTQLTSIFWKFLVVTGCLFSVLVREGQWILRIHLKRISKGCLKRKSTEAAFSMDARN